MGQMLRENFWIPAARAARLVADGAPIRVRLLGQNFVAFRATDGRIGMFDEACPHRGVSLTLARNEDCALRCIFHGWKIDVSGRVVETPTESREPEAFAAGVKVNHYPVREAGGLLWVWLGKREPDPFPDFPFNTLSTEDSFVACTPLPFNWVQAVDATVDSAHVGFLHRNSVAKMAKHYASTVDSLAPYYEIENRPYGMSAAAIRPMADGRSYVRVTEFVMPFSTIAYGQTDDEGVYQIMVPVDNVNTLWFVVRWSTTGADLGPTFMAPPDADLDNWVPLLGGPETHWGQDREAMANGSFSGFDRGLLTEDTVVQASMGAIVDRSKEYLSSGDLAVVRARRLLLKAAHDHQAGKRPRGSGPDVRRSNILASAGYLNPGEDWRSVFERERPVVQGLKVAELSTG
ncbi:MAG TPA: Rieske 2Fe-2S domain-containing protein [Caulobacteraceae bacterium]|nr:Rieske 2Fe-2S domain-containing protein [Caulobacteraceae bacterium]